MPAANWSAGQARCSPLRSGARSGGSATATFARLAPPDGRVTTVRSGGRPPLPSWPRAPTEPDRRGENGTASHPVGVNLAVVVAVWPGES